MIAISDKTLEDFEFPEVLKQVSQYALTSLGQETVSAIRPIESLEFRTKRLRMVSEYLLGVQNNSDIPSHHFKNLNEIITLLRIENSILSPQQLNAIVYNHTAFNNVTKHFKKFKILFPQLHELGSHLKINDHIPRMVNEKIDQHHRIRDQASQPLFQIRRELNRLKIQMTKSFQSSLNHYAAKGYLNEIKESMHGDRRVLAVKAPYRKRIHGTTLGSSKNSTIIYVEPIENANLHLEFQNLKFEEKEEETQILLQLTHQIREYTPHFRQQQNYLLEVDVISACGKYAQEISATLPQLSDLPEFDFKKAKHPLLLISNRKSHLPTFPQDISLHDHQRIIVISGPNAGGKSITLKTVGLLQIMIQSGLLIPVDTHSLCGFFPQILSDIGDNQSIENQLSTYSYRMKNMRSLLKKADEKTLFLIDEFGTGSDPDLGGALAEATLEQVYHRNSRGIITTHYSNLKLMAHRLEYMVNANMPFDTKTLEPLYQLAIGDAGSSFTFEVAEKIGIPYNIINKAKKKISKEKLSYSTTISKLQKEKAEVNETKRALEKKQNQATLESKKSIELNQKLNKKLNAFETLFQENQKFVSLGKKFSALAQRYHNPKHKKSVFNDLFNLLQIESVKNTGESYHKKKLQDKKLIENLLKNDLNQYVQKKRQHDKKKTEQKSLKPLTIGDKVRISDSESVGTIEKIVKNKGFVNFGNFMTEVKMETLELVHENGTSINE